MDAATRKLGLMVSTAPDHPNLQTALGLATAALDRGAEVYLYLIDDGVAGVEDLSDPECGERAGGEPQLGEAHALGLERRVAPEA